MIVRNKLHFPISLGQTRSSDETNFLEETFKNPKQFEHPSVHLSLDAFDFLQMYFAKINIEKRSRNCEVYRKAASSIFISSLSLRVLD
jgi:hypothetical protein